MMTEWLDKIHNCGFSVDVLFTKDGDKLVVLHWKNGYRNVKCFQDVDADKCMAEALQFAELYDAFVNTPSGCGVVH